MLYKKYHRDYVRKFKKGIKFSPTSDGGWDFYIGKSCVVRNNPSILAIKIIKITKSIVRGYIIITKVDVSTGDNKRERHITLTLIDHRGKLINYVSKD